MANRTTEQDRPLHILTVNVNGLKTNGDKLLEELKKLKSENREVDVVLLTETKIGENDTLENYEGWEIFPTRHDSRSRGAAVMLNKKSGFDVIASFPGGSGHYMILNCRISEISYTFVSVYHHKDETGLLWNLSEKIEKEIKPLKTDRFVVGGDFNVALEDIDRTDGYGHRYHYRIRQELRSFMDRHTLIDAWRRMHPGEKDYTYEYLHEGKLCCSRLDYFFIKDEEWELVQDCRINQVRISDHYSVSLILHLKTPSTDVETLEMDKLKIVE